MAPQQNGQDQLVENQVQIVEPAAYAYQKQEADNQE